jgi:hypothetical protein
MITTTMDDYLWFVDTCLDDMVQILEGLGDELANTRPDLRGANAPYAIVTHCLGVLNHWGGDEISGRQVVRDRDAEFVATGPVAPLREQVRRARARFAEDLEHLDPQAAPVRPLDDSDAGLPFARTQSAVLWHVFHELAQHLGHLEITRDVLLAGHRRGAP